MPKRLRPVVECLVYDEIPTGVMAYPAFGGRHRVYDLSKRDVSTDASKSLLMNYVSADVLGQAGTSGGTRVGGHDYYEAVRFVPSPVAAAMAYPMPDRRQQLTLNYFDAIGAHQNSWNDGEGGVYSVRPDTLACYLYNYYGGALSDGASVGLRSRFSYSSNPIICLDIDRWDCPPQFLNTMNPCTNIVFGTDKDQQYIISIPYADAPSLWMKHATLTKGAWVNIKSESEGSLNLASRSNRGNAAQAGDVKRIWIGCFAGGIALSEDAFGQITFFPLRFGEPTVNHACGVSPIIPSSPIEIHHNAGQIGISVLPVKMALAGIVQGPLERVPYNIKDADTYTDLFINPRQQTVLDKEGAVVGVVTAEITCKGGTPDAKSRIPKDLTGFEWRALIPSVPFTSVFSGSGLSTANSSTDRLTFKTCVSPLLYDVIYGQPATLLP
ncbi:MAG: hypothetical protein ACYC63_04860 [Armatimonadota bacterium]